MKKKLKDFQLGFFGTPRFAVYVLEELEKGGIVPDVIVTQPDRPAGRGLKLTASPVKIWALERHIPLEATPPEVDLFVVTAYGKILPKEMLAVPRKGTLNVHPSLLPKFRGPSPIESQILADDRECGVTVIKLDDEVDHGPIVAQASVTPEVWPMRASILEEMLAREGGKLLAETIPPYMEGSIVPESQDHTKATFTKKIQKEDGLIEIRHPMSDFEAYQNYLKFCAYDEWPGTFFFKDDVRYKITDAVLENASFKPLRVIPEGKTEREWKT